MLSRRIVDTDDLALPYSAKAESVLIDSGEWTGEAALEAQEKMAKHAEANGFGKATTTYRLKDWGVSRQRYWGTPIPIVYCDRCGMQPVPGGAAAGACCLRVSISRMSTDRRWDVCRSS